MPRLPSGAYQKPNPPVVTNTAIGSTDYNTNVADVETDLNTIRPILYGGTGASSAAGALTALGAEQNNQIVTNYDTQAWVSGSFSSATTATNPPVAGRRFAGIAYVADTGNIILEARDLDSGVAPPLSYVRQKNAGNWGPWALDAGFYGNIGLGQCYLSASGGNLVLTPLNGNRITINSTAQTIPDSGISLPPAGTSTNTLYYIYAYWTGTAIALEFSTTAYAAQAGTGIKIKSGDATRTLVGLWATSAASAIWSAYPTDGASYFNPVRKTTWMDNSTTAISPATTSASLVEMSSSYRSAFVTFVNREVVFGIRGRMNGSTGAGGYINMMDAISTPQLAASINNTAVSSAWSFFSDSYAKVFPTEAKRYLTGAFSSAGGTLTCLETAWYVTTMG